ncbi:hypothetical protein PPERSA_05713 [Pseudocohnilembus persalinus]|uniref:Uncharacterized protein n=1 Tax=Pseudocohnilembus persalinus TaxID=266149 RepID=A0A0V0QI48_PSEPJ|nr:hypothetical protein PPERSA_05713 [Pseudocohnilembus persalinus]|eukprot:KRX01874.1 hypothetical protein PPERSA_05713 [Pseudocohnilembus persalinus]
MERCSDNQKIQNKEGKNIKENQLHSYNMKQNHFKKVNNLFYNKNDDQLPNITDLSQKNSQTILKNVMQIFGLKDNQFLQLEEIAKNFSKIIMEWLPQVKCILQEICQILFQNKDHEIQQIVPTLKAKILKMDFLNYPQNLSSKINQ